MEEEGAHEPPTLKSYWQWMARRVSQVSSVVCVAHGRLPVLSRQCPTPLHIKTTVFGLSGGENKRAEPRSWEVDGGESQGGDGAGMRKALNLLYSCMKLPKSK